jgi:hypothetical protein
MSGGIVGKVVVGTVRATTVRSVRFQFPKLKFVGGPDVLTGSKQKKYNVHPWMTGRRSFWLSGVEVCVSCRVVSYRIVEGTRGKCVR